MAAWGNFVLDKGFDAAAALTIYRAVKMSAEETVTPVTAITDVPIGVAQFGVTSGEILKGKGASVRVLGVTEWEASAALTVGTHFLVTITTDGRCKPAATGERVVGVLVKGASGAGARASVLLHPGGFLSP
jgi:hypothetical protein